MFEIGSGDGRLLKNIANLFNNSDNILFLGTETDSSLYLDYCRKLNNNNICFINEPFENVLLQIASNTLDIVLSILPCPKYIDKNRQEEWIPMYSLILNRMKEKGFFILVTELIDELLQPVSLNDYLSWKKWISDTFCLIGFKIVGIIDGTPSCISSYCIDKFTNDPQRIRITTIMMTKG